MLKPLILILVSVLFVTCSDDNPAPPQNGVSCSVVQRDDSAFITCTDGTEAEIKNGKDGTDGKDGAKGNDGSSCSVSQLNNGAKIECTDGTFAYVYNGNDGKDGLDGADGNNGSNGLDGSSCSVASTPTGASISCTNGSVVELYNGIDGADGNDGIDGASCTVTELLNGLKIECGDDTAIVYDSDAGPVEPASVVKIIDPCGDLLGEHDEVLLVTANNDILSYYEDGGKRFLTILEVDTTYKTTDKQKCRFTVNSDGTITE